MSINILILLPLMSSVFAGKLSSYPNLNTKGIAYDSRAQHFIIWSVYNRTFLSISLTGTADILIPDRSLPPNSSILGIEVDLVFNRLLAVVHSFPPFPPFNALAAYDLRSRSRVFLSILPDAEGFAVANGVAVDYKGNAFVTNSLGNSSGNFIWKVNRQGEASIFSRSPVFNQYAVDPDAPFSSCGLNGIGYNRGGTNGIDYNSEGYLLVVQTNTGKIFKVNTEDGAAKSVPLSKNLTSPTGIAVRAHTRVGVLASGKVWFLSSEDWENGELNDETELEKRFPTSVVAGRMARVYVLYESGFEVKVVRSKKEIYGEHVILYLLLAYSLVFMPVLYVFVTHGKGGPG